MKFSKTDSDEIATQEEINGRMNSIQEINSESMIESPSIMCLDKFDLSFVTRNTFIQMNSKKGEDRDPDIPSEESISDDGGADQVPSNQ